MNYFAHYDRLVCKAQQRKIQSGYEQHHVLPRCLGGDDSIENIVRLTPREHYLAHELLVKMHPGIPGLTYAVLMMGGKGKIGKHASRAYAQIRKQASAFLSRARRGKSRPESAMAAMRAATKGKPLSDSHKKKLSDANRGKRMPDDVKQRMIKGLTGQKRSPEYCAQVSARNMGTRRGLGNRSRTGLKNSVEMREKISVALSGRKFSVERRMNIAKGQAKFSSDDIQRMLRSRADGSTVADICAAFRVSDSHARRILARTSYQWA